MLAHTLPMAGSTHVRQEVDERIPSEGAHGQGEEEVVGLVVVARLPEGGQQHGARQTDASNENHRHHAPHPTGCGGRGKLEFTMKLKINILFTIIIYVSSGFKRTNGNH